MSKQVSSLISTTTDFTRLIERLRHLPAHPNEELRRFFDRDLPIHVARAPGRLDVMGGIGDYSGSLVLEMPIVEAAFVAVQPSREEGIRIVSSSQDESTVHRFFSLSANDFARLTQSNYDSICKELGREPDSSWAAYILGPLFVLFVATGAKLSGGLRILIDSQFPKARVSVPLPRLRWRRCVRSPYSCKLSCQRGSLRGFAKSQRFRLSAHRAESWIK